jgi:hypothetical protein
MSAAIALRFEDDTANPIAVQTVLAVEATGLTVNVTQTAQNITDGVHAAPISYYLTGECTGEDTLVSPVFQGAAFTWDDLVVPAAGSWTFHVRKVSDDSSVANSGAKTFDAP